MTNKVLFLPRLKRRVRYSNFNHYRQFRQEIRQDCQGRCVYCDVHENELGGQDAMTLDHFKPKDKFASIEHHPANLVWSCFICNQAKGNLWPAYGSIKGNNVTFVNEAGFLDPFVEDLHTYFDIAEDGAFVPLKPPARYMIRVLKLNRIGAKIARQNRRLRYEEREIMKEALVKAIREADDMLDMKDLPTPFLEKVSHHKEMLSQQYDTIVARAEPDFNLY